MTFPINVGSVIGPQGPPGPSILVWDEIEEEYVEAPNARIYVGGPTDPTTEEGDIWVEIVEESV